MHLFIYNSIIIKFFSLSLIDKSSKKSSLFLLTLLPERKKPAWFFLLSWIQGSAYALYDKAGQAYHKIVNAHIYEDQLELMRDVQLIRDPYPAPQIIINPDIKSLEDIETWVTLDDFEVEGYQHHDPIKYPFSV